jgi:hypothetical protein
MRARTIAQIAALIAGHMGGPTTAPAAPAPAPAEGAPAAEVDLDALSDEEIDRLLADSADSDEAAEGEKALR